MRYHQSSVPRSYFDSLEGLALFASLSAKVAIRKYLFVMGILFFCSVAFTPGRPVSASAPKDLGKRVEELIRASGAETVAVSYYDLDSDAELLINPDITFHAASTMKVPVMMEIFRQAA